MNKDFRHMQLVKTPKGKAVFIGYLVNGHEAQVSRIVPAMELNREDCIQRNATLKEYTADEFNQWRKSADFCINETYPVSQLEAL